MKTDEFYDYRLNKQILPLIQCLHEDLWGKTTLDGIRCFLCNERISD